MNAEELAQVGTNVKELFDAQRELWNTKNFGAMGPIRAGVVEEHMENVIDNYLLKKYKFLDFGSGTGRLYPLFRKYDYYAVDIAEELINQFRDAYPNDKLNITLMEEDKIPFDDGFFDVVWAYSVFTHTSFHLQDENILKEFSRVLKTGGMCLFTVFDIKYVNQGGWQNKDVDALTKLAEKYSLKFIDRKQIPEVSNAEQSLLVFIKTEGKA